MLSQRTVMASLAFFVVLSPCSGLQLKQRQLKAGMTTLRQFMQKDSCLDLDLSFLSSDALLRMVRDKRTLGFLSSMHGKGMLNHLLGSSSAQKGSVEDTRADTWAPGEHSAKRTDFTTTGIPDNNDCCKNSASQCGAEIWYHEDGTWATILSEKHHVADFEICMENSESDESGSACKTELQSKPMDCKDEVVRDVKLAKDLAHMTQSPGCKGCFKAANLFATWGDMLGYSQHDKPQASVASPYSSDCQRLLRILPPKEDERPELAEFPDQVKEVLSLALPGRPQWQQGPLQYPSRFHQKEAGTRAWESSAVSMNSMTESMLDRPMRVDNSSEPVIHYVLDLQDHTDGWLEKLQ